MPLNIALTPEYGYCVAAFFATILCNFYKVVTVVKARKLYDVQYPNLYAPDGHKNKKEFDCAQRQHQQGPHLIETLVMSGAAGLSYRHGLKY